MKKALKRLLAGVSALAVMVTGAISVSAEITYNGIDTDAYREYVSAKTEAENKELLYDLHSDMISSYVSGTSKPTISEVVNIYAPNSSENILPCITYYYETYNVYPESAMFPDYEAAHFRDIVVHYDTYKLDSADFTSEELDKFLSENNLKASVAKFDATDSEVNISLAFDNDMTTADAEKMSYAVYKEFGIRPYKFTHLIDIHFYNKELNKLDYINKEETSPSVNPGAPTIAGDLDLNNEQGIADIVALTKYNTSAELFPITDATALANADINQDGTIDAIDTSLLIEIMLGTFESAV